MILLAASIISCQKQEAPVVSPEESWEIRDLERLEACSKVNFTQDLLRHENAFYLFKCTGWDKLFPSLTRGISNINPESWNHFFRPIDDAFLNDKQRRDRVFDHVRELDSKGGLDDLSRVMTALNETNFYNGLRDLFVCSENPSHPNCKERKGRELSRSQIKDLLRLVELEPVFIKSLAVMINESMHAMGDDTEKLRDEIRKFFYKKEFVNVRLKLVSSIAQKYLQGLSPLERIFAKKILTTRFDDSEDPYLYHWVQRPIFNNAVFRRLTNYAVTENPEVIKDIKLLKRGYHYPLYCKPYSESGRIDIDLKTHVDEFLEYVYQNTYEEFHNFIIQNVASLQLAITFCPKLKNYSGEIAYVENGEVRRGNHSLNFVELEKKLVDLTSEVPIFDLSKFVTFLTSRNLGDIPPNPGFLLDLATEEAVEWLVEIARIIMSSSDNFFDLNFKMLKSTRLDFYNAGGVLVNEFLAKENENKIKALSKTWLFFNKEEQNFLFNFIDRHLQENSNFRLLFNFYATMLEEYAIVSQSFGEKWTATDELREKSYEALFDIVNNFSGPSVLEDFSKFFSRDHIITIMKVVTRGPQYQRVALERLRASLITDYLSSLPQTPYEIEFTSGDNEYSRKAKICVDALTEDTDLYVILNNFPKECSFFKDKEISLQTFAWLADAQSRYERDFNIQAKPAGTLLDKDGLLSSKNLNNSIAILRMIDEVLSFRGEDKKITGGIRYLLDIGEKHLFDIVISGKKGLKADLVKLNEILSGFLKEGGFEARYLRNKMIFDSMVDEGPTAEELLQLTSSLLEDYVVKLDEGALEPETYIEDVAFSCSSFVHHGIGGLPCPTKQRIKRGLKSIVSDLTVVYEEDGRSTVGYFLDALVPGYGLSIPLDSKNPRLKRLTTKESAEMVYKLTDPKYEINRKKIEFRENDEYDQNYDVDNWSGLKWRKSTNELKDIDEDEEHVKPEDELFFKKDEVQVNTLERVEITMRDVRFDMNYLGAHYKNAVAKADNYNDVVDAKLKMFKTCTSVRFCGKFFNREQIRMAKNAVEAYPGLYDANAYEEFKFGDYMQSLLGTFVRSSTKKAQKSSLVKIKIFGKKIEVPWVQTKKQLRKHNGKILTKISMLTGFSNLARFVRDRMGRTPEEFQKNISSEKSIVLEKYLFSGIDPVALEEPTKQLLLSIAGERGADSVLTEFIDWVSENDYQSQREFEEVVMNTLVIASFIGVGPARGDYKLNDDLYERYRDNNLTPIIMIANEIVPTLMNFKGSWPVGFDFMTIIKKISKPIKFLADDLIKNRDLNDKKSYRLLNEGFIFIKRFLGTKTENSEIGSKYLADYLRKPGAPAKVLEVSRSMFDYMEYLEKTEVGKSGFTVLSENLAKVIEDSRFDLSNIKQYFLSTTKVHKCSQRSEVNCERNVHYDEISQLIIFGGNNSTTKKTNLERMIDTLFKSHINDYSDMVDNLFPLIRVNPTR